MFTTKCFIRKNTHELRKKLEEFGYKNRHLSMSTNVEHYPLLSVYHDGCYQGVFGDECGLEFYIDCGENEELFFAVASLRNDTDKYQWFIYNSMDCTVEKLRDFYWFKCEEDKIEDMMYWDCAYLNCTKATVEEIIEHFKNPICQEIGD